MPDELSEFSECFITGTAARGRRCRRSPSGNSRRGSITQQLMGDYTAEVQPKGKAAAA